MRRKASRIVLLIVLMFFVQWLPMWLFQLHQTFATSKSEHIRLVNLVITLISYANSITNPALYMFLTYNFKKNCRAIFKNGSFFFAAESKLKLNQFL